MVFVQTTSFFFQSVFNCNLLKNDITKTFFLNIYMCSFSTVSHLNLFLRFLWIIISKITLSETLAKHILFTSDRYSKLDVQDYIIFLQYELNIHLFYQELQIKTNRSKTYTDIPYRNWTWQHSERSSFIIRKHIKIEKEKGDEKKKKYFVNLQTILILSMKI